MNILFVAPMPMIPSNGGIQRVSDILAQSFQNLGHKVFFLCRRDWQDRNNERLSAPQSCIPISQEKADKSIGQYHEFLANNKIECVIFQWVDPLIELWLKNTPEHIRKISTLHTQPFSGYYFSGAIIRKSAVHSCKQLIWKCLGYTFPFLCSLYIKKAELRRLSMLSTFSDRLCLLSKAFIPRIESIAPSFKTDNLVAINNPFDGQCLYANQDKENLIVMVCRIENESKNVFGFVDIWRKVVERNPDWNAVIVGDGVDFQRIKKYASKKGTRNLEFVGQQHDVSPYYQRAKIQLITSFTEGFSMVMVEGMAAGCVPVVFNTFESVEDILDDTIDGLVVKALDNNAMADKVQYLIDNEDVRLAMSEKASKKIRKFASDIITRQWLDLIHSIKKETNKSN